MQQNISHNSSNANASAWHVIHTRPRQEQRALENLQQQGFEVYMPMLEAQILRRGKMQPKYEPLFKRYIFVRFDAQLSPWHVIRSTLGVHQLLKFGGQLATVPDALIASLKAIETPQQALYASGEALRVKAGPFKELEVIYEMADGDTRAIVLIELLNKTQRIALSLDVLAKAD